MSGSNLFEHPIIQGSGFPLAYGTEIPTHDPGKAGKFGDMKPLPMGIQLLQITGMVKNAWNLLDLPLLKTQICIVDFVEEILGMTTIGFPDTGSGFPLVTSSEIGNAEIVIKQWDMRIDGDETFQLGNDLPGITLGEFVEIVNARLHLGWEPLDVAIVERFVGDVVLSVHQASRRRWLKHTRCGGRLG
jgi:hypothetical protein